MNYDNKILIIFISLVNCKLMSHLISYHILFGTALYLACEKIYNCDVNDVKRTMSD